MNESSSVSPVSSDFSRSPLSVEGIRHAAGSHGQAQEVARHFEALLIQEVVKAARNASGDGWLGEDAGESSEATAQMGEEFLANAIAAGGGFGLAALFARSLEATLAESPSPDSPVPSVTLEKNSENF
ncbi:MAG: hypothetical protein U5J83_11085 [Bryobacterales bacterium]|nr:hypothetical protein [Bryobacterales bacterium]